MHGNMYFMICVRVLLLMAVLVCSDKPVLFYNVKFLLSLFNELPYKALK